MEYIYEILDEFDSEEFYDLMPRKEKLIQAVNELMEGFSPKQKEIFKRLEQLYAEYEHHLKISVIEMAMQYFNKK